MERTRRVSWMQLGEDLDAYAFIAPWLIGFLVLTAGPMLGSVILVLSDWDLSTPGRPEGDR